MNIAPRRILDGLFVGGVLIRLAVLIAASPFNADGHFEVIQYIARHAALPVSNQLSQSYHPPLYYVLMAPVYAWWSDPAPIHFFSFVFSIANLFLIRRLLENALVIGIEGGRAIAFALVCFVPQIVMFGSFISNDTLAMLVGTALFAVAVKYIEEPGTRTRSILAVFIGVGLLTKGTFLLAAPALTCIVLFNEWHVGSRHAAAAAIGVFVIWSAIGCFKYVDNIARVGNPLINNLDVDSAFKREQSGTWKGWKTAYDFDIIKLIRQPVIDKKNALSYPLLMYATFWYPHIPDSSFDGNVRGYQWVGSIIYAAAVIPTLILFAGAARASVMALKLVRGRAPPGQEGIHRVALVALVLLLSNIIIVLAAGVKYDIWSCFQSRLCFPSLAPAMVLFGLGFKALSRHPLAARLADAGCWATVLSAVLYFCVEIPLTYGWLPKGPR